MSRLAVALSWASVASCAWVVWLRCRRTGTSLPRALGLVAGSAALRDAAGGFVLGSVAVAGIFLVERIAGWIVVAGVGPSRESLRWLALLPASAFAEEVLFRGVLLTGLVVLLRRRWPALAAGGAMFGLAHLSNPHATPLSAVSTALGGIVYGLAFLWTDAIWAGFGLHLAWNVVQGPVLGFPVSGIDMGGS
ncbi:MAG TPA: CPBP family intramembrane glutamic endopeptidase [Gemmatimonadota bacterium]